MYENIDIKYPNFCLGPQAGTLCTIDMTNAQTVLRVKNLAGSNIVDYTFSSNIITDDVKIEYIGPYNLSSMVDDLTFFTFERVSATSCLIKRWQTRVAYRELLLKEQVVKYSSGDEKFDATAFAVEFYHRSFAKPNESYNYIVMSNTEDIKNGTKLFLGPSTDTTNPGVTEKHTVSSVVTYGDEERVYLTDNIQYQYATGDTISVYNYVYVVSQLGYAGDTTKGTIYKLDAYSWSTVQRSSRSWYKRISSARWCPVAGAIAGIVGTNMLFLRPYNSYLNWRSMYLRNVTANQSTVFPVHDVVFDQQSIYKLQERTTRVDDYGTRTDYSWDSYNYQEDTLLPYNSSVVTWLEQSVLTGYNKNVDINTQVRDQFHVSLRDVTLNFYMDGDPDALFDPLSGIATTDENGRAVMNFRSGADYTGHTEITVRAQNGSTVHGSSYVWTANNIITYPTFDEVLTLIWLEYSCEGSGWTRLINEVYAKFGQDDLGNDVWLPPEVVLLCKTFFTSPGGDWGPASSDSYMGTEEIKEWLPQLYLGDGVQTDSVFSGNRGGMGFTIADWDVEGTFFIGDRLTLHDNFEAENSFTSVTDFLVSHGAKPIDLPEGTTSWPPTCILYQPEEAGALQISQLNLSLHTHWVDAEAQDELWTYVDVDQFVFVEDAVPAFWSEKNPIDTNIWIRLRPFAFSLDSTTFRMWVREISPFGDTGYYEVTDSVVLETFDAGGGVLGLEATYNPSEDFDHDATVYVRIEVYDEAYTPNFVYTDYWFMVTPDYKAPYLTNLSPSRGQMFVAVDQEIYFEIVDEGAGIDFDNIEVLLNSRLLKAPELSIEQVNRKLARVTYTPPEPLYFGKEYKVAVKANDVSYQENRLNDSYYFYTVDSSGVYITDPTPGICKRGMQRFEDVSVVVLADGTGVDKDSIRMQVFNKDVSPKVIPIIYRIS